MGAQSCAVWGYATSSLTYGRTPDGMKRCGIPLIFELNPPIFVPRKQKNALRDHSRRLGVSDGESDGGKSDRPFGMENKKRLFPEVPSGQM